MRFDKRDDGAAGGAEQVVDELLGSRRGRPRIRCPKCAWQPRRGDRWYCSKCKQGVWNTFDTRGVCPVCRYQWAWTICLRCHEWSPHDDWYERDDEPGKA